jgi:protein SCO1/2
MTVHGLKRKFVAVGSLFLTTQIWAAENHSVKGILVESNPATHSIVVSCDAVPGYMEPMVMSFTVRGNANLKTLAPGMSVSFEMVEGKNEAFAEHLQVLRASNHESEPTEASRLTFLHRALDPAAEAKIIKIGQLVPDFALTDQTQQTTRLSQFRGKVVALTFTYSRCPNPNYCFRLSNNLSMLGRRFRGKSERNLMLITIVIDPDQDRGKALEKYADTWRADPAAWRFLTGSLSEVQEVAERFGMNFWSDEGFLTHTFHTVVIDRNGDLAANMEGNQFTAQQLGDLVESVLRRPMQSQ